MEYLERYPYWRVEGHEQMGIIASVVVENDAYRKY